MKRSLLSAFVVLTCPSFALETKPWFGDKYAFNFEGSFAYSRFNKVEGASKQLSAPLNNRDILLDLGFTPYEFFDMQIEGEFGKTNDVNWALRSGALQARFQLLDDISGDPVSLAFGVIFRGAPDHFLRDVSTPYAAEFNTELTCSVGKEWSENGVWTMRTYGFAAIGQANRGYPWTRELLVWQYNLKDTHRFTFFGEGDFGFGNRQHVNVDHFRGWGKFQHQSIDLGLSYGYKIGFYGILTASYAHRVFAHNFPEHVNFFMLSYCLPFSLF
ncbi:MAG: hypothetical protein JSS60_03045 [Verrucomicrobia bacterium]|nr:hypothetical protein [Verrucomicrobiota bacterium]